MRYWIHRAVRQHGASCRHLGLSVLLMGAILLPQQRPTPPAPINAWANANEARSTGSTNEGTADRRADSMAADSWWRPGPGAQIENPEARPVSASSQTHSESRTWPNIGLPYDLAGRPAVYSAETVEIGAVADWTRVVYESYRDGNWEIYAANGDGTSVVRLTSHPANDIRPSLDRGAKRVVFASDRDRKDRYEIYSIDVNGENLRRLTDNDVIDSQPAWSPDGNRIAFVSLRDGNAEIYVMNADGSGQMRITYSSRIDFSPCWSPDGRHLVWVRAEDEYEGILMRANVDGSYAHSLGNSMRYLQHPAYAPDGSWIAFDADLNRDWWSDLGRMLIADDSRRVEQIRTAESSHDLWLGNWSPQVEAYDGHTKLLITKLDYEWGSDGYFYLSNTAIQFVSIAGHLIGTWPGTGLDAFPNMQSEDVWPPHKPFIAPFDPYTSIGDQPTVDWSASDVGEAGVIMYSCQEWGADSEPHEVQTVDTTMNLDASPGEVYSVRVRAEDAAGQWSPWSDTRSTLAYTWRVTGSVKDNNDVPLAYMTVGAFPEGLAPVHTGADGRYTVRLVGEGSHRFSVSSPLYAPGTPSVSRDVTGHTSLDLSFIPDDNVIRNGSFEGAPRLADWYQTGNAIASPASYDGEYAAQLTLPGPPESAADSNVGQRVKIPMAMHRPTLTFIYLLRPGKAEDVGFHVSVADVAAPAETVVMSTTQAVQAWTYTSVDLSDWRGKEVDLIFHLAGNVGEEVARARLDRISLGSWRTPVPTAIVPSRVNRSRSRKATISGLNFIDRPKVFLGDTQLTDVIWQSSQEVTAVLPAAMAPGIYDLRVTNPGGYTSGRLSAFYVGTQTYLPLMQID